MKFAIAVVVLSLLSVGTSNPAVIECKPTDKTDWSYNYACNYEEHGQLAPDMWSELYPECAGQRQSPITIDLSHLSIGACDEAPVTGGFKFSVGTCTSAALVPEASIKNWEIKFDEELCGELPSFTLGNGKTYKLLQFHFHSASEHSISGAHYDAELHLVHVNVDDDMDYAVLGIMYSESENDLDNEELNHYWPMLKANEYHARRATEGEDVVLNPYALLPPNPTYYSYLGSLTTPPCLEVVSWVVMELGSYMSSSQLQAMRMYYADMEYTLADAGGNNFRPVQPLNGRTIYRC